MIVSQSNLTWVCDNVVVMVWRKWNNIARGCWNQCLVGQPAVANTARHVLGIDWTSLWILTRDSCSSVWVSGSRWRTRLSSSSRRCLLGLRSVDPDDHGNTLMFSFYRKSIVTRALCGLEMSCWKSSLCRSKTGSMWRRITSSR